LLTERLVMREWRDDDRDPYAAINADPEVMRHFPSMLTPQQSSEMIDRMAAAWLNRGFGLWAVERRDAAELIGFVGLAVPGWETPFAPCVEVGWRLGRKHWGNGFAPEAAITALEWGFANLDPPGDEIVSFTTESNLNSQRVMEKIGMIRDLHGDFDHPMFPDWAERRHVLYRIDRRQFTERVAR
jgi:RimJ/RimL family protein N-acetyltransferase